MKSRIRRINSLSLRIATFERFLESAMQAKARKLMRPNRRNASWFADDAFRFESHITRSLTPLIDSLNSLRNPVVS